MKRKLKKWMARCAMLLMALALILVMISQISVYAEGGWTIEQLESVHAAVGQTYDTSNLDPSQATVKPTLALSRQTIKESEIPEDGIVTVKLTVDGADKAYTSTGIHIQYDSRLELIQQTDGQWAKLGDNQDGFLALNDYGLNTTEVNANNHLLFVANSGFCIPGVVEYVGKDGVLWEMDFKLPKDAKEGDLYPIVLYYQYRTLPDNSIVSDRFSNDDNDLLMEAYVFTQGCEHGYIKITSTPHTHNFTYSATGATITATCTDGCDITDGRTLTINAPTGDLTYDGTTMYPATLSTGYNTTAFPDTYTISYTRNGAEFTGTPTEAGDYTASVTVGTGDNAATACVSFTIGQKDTNSTVPEKQTLTYNGTQQPLVKPGKVEGGTLYYALGNNDTTAPADGWSTEVPTATEAGTYNVWYKVEGDANHNDVPPACIVVTIADQPLSSDYTLLASLKTSGKKALKMSWTAVSDAQGYDIFFGQCSKGDSQYLASVNGTSYKIKGLKKGVAYKAYVRAWKTVGGAKEYIGEASPDMHAITGGKSNHYTNPKKISVKKKKLTLAVGQSKSIKAKLKKYNSSRSYLKHVAKVRYFSSDRTVAVVDAKGRMTGVGVGKCTVYAVAENGLRVGVKVTVK